MRTEMAPYAVPLLLAAGLLFGITIFAWRRRGVAGALSLAGLSLCAGSWALADGLLVLSDTWATYPFWWKAGYFGIVSVPIALLVFALDYAGRRSALTARNIAALSSVPVIALVLVLTEPRHGLMWTVTDLDWSRPYVPTVQRGAAFWVETLYAYGLMLAAEVIFIRLFKRSRRVYRRQSYIMLAAILLPWLPNIIHVFGFNPVEQFDLTPLTFAASAPLLTLSVFRYRLRDFVPVARRAVFDDLGDGVIIVGRDGLVVDVNPAAAKTLKLDAEHDWRMTLEELCPALAAALAGDENASDFSYGEPPRHFDLAQSPLDDPRGGVAGSVIMLRDVTARRELEQQLAYNAERDPLSGLLNRTHFEARLHRLWLEHSRDLTLFFIDLDGFKEVNDRLGHQAGDQTLIGNAERLTEASGAHDVVARWGGDEFAVLSRLPKAAGATVWGTKLLAACADNQRADNHVVTLSASIGIALAAPTTSTERLIQLADGAMYRAKRAGKNRFHVATAEAQARSTLRHAPGVSPVGDMPSQE